MKRISLVFLMLIAFLTCSHIFAAERYDEPRVLPYYVDLTFSLKEDLLVDYAATHISDAIGCISLQRSYVLPNDKTVLHVRPMFKKEEKRIGVCKYNEHAIEIYRDQTEEMFFKVTVHEFAHALGMVTHAFKESEKYNSLITPVVSTKSFPLLSNQDVAYLKALFCEEEFLD